MVEELQSDPALLEMFVHRYIDTDGKSYKTQRLAIYIDLGIFRFKPDSLSHI